MATVSETIPEPLRPEVDAACSWYGRRRGLAFEVTGILDPDVALAASGARELRLVLCGGDLCEQRSFVVTPGAGGFSVRLLEEGPAGASERVIPPAELDPPPGARRGWLDAALARHAFVVLVFYRGFW